MSTIRESRHVSIEMKIVKLEDLHRLAAVVKAEHSESLEQEQHSSASFLAGCADNSSFESEDIDIFGPESFLAKKRVLSASMEFHRYSDNSYISIDLNHGNYGSNAITVVGTDSTWVNGITSKLSNIVDSFDPQSGFVRNHPRLLNGILALGYGSVFTWFVTAIPSSPPQDIPEWARILRELFDKAPILRTLFRYLIGIPVGIFPAFWTTWQLSELWPTVEIQIGPEHLFVEKRRRKWIALVFTGGVLPLLLSVIYDVLKALGS